MLAKVSVFFKYILRGLLIFKKASKFDRPLQLVKEIISIAFKFFRSEFEGDIIKSHKSYSSFTNFLCYHKP